MVYGILLLLWFCVLVFFSGVAFYYFVSRRLFQLCNKEYIVLFKWVFVIFSERISFKYSLGNLLNQSFITKIHQLYKHQSKIYSQCPYSFPWNSYLTFNNAHNNQVNCYDLIECSDFNQCRCSRYDQLQLYMEKRGL